MGEKLIQLNDWERTRILVMRAEARTLRRSPSTISHELRRNGHKDSYSAVLAGQKAQTRRGCQAAQDVAGFTPAKLCKG